jgi:putative redox protein
MMEITFTGGLKVRAELDGLTVDTDQPVASGGGGEAAGPYDLFLASLGTCAGFFALRFMQQRGIDPTGARLTLATDKDPETGLAATVRIDLELPHDFPDKYRQAVVRAMDQCKVKRQLEHPPVVGATTSLSGPAASTADSTTHTSS